MGFLPCPNFPCYCYDQNSDQQSRCDNTGSNSSSFNSSLSSQTSILSVPSLTPSTHQVDHLDPTEHRHHISTLKGHSSYVVSLALAGKHLYSGSSNGELRIWSRDPSSMAGTGSRNTVAEGYSGVKSILILGDRVFTAHQDYKIRVWKIDVITNRNYKSIATLPTINDRCMSLFSAKNYVQVRRHKKCTWVHHVDAISALALSRDGSLLYSVSWDRTFKVWKTSNFDCLESLWNAHDDAINAIVLSNDAHVYTGSADRKIKVWKKNEGEKHHSLIATLEKHKSSINALALTTDGSILYSGAAGGGSIVVWEKDGSCHMAAVGALKGHNKAILCLTVVSDLLCSGSADKTVRIWRRGIGKNHSCLAVFDGHKGPVKCLAAAVDNNRSTEANGPCGTCYLVYSGSLDFDVRIWQIWVPPL